MCEDFRGQLQSSEVQSKLSKDSGTRWYTLVKVLWPHLSSKFCYLQPFFFLFRLDFFLC